MKTFGLLKISFTSDSFNGQNTEVSFFYIFILCIFILEHLISITVLTMAHKYLCPKPD